MNMRHPGPVGDGLPAEAPRGQRARDMLAAELLADLHHAMLTNTAEVAKLTGRIQNDTLEVGTYIFDAAGVIGSQYRTAAGCIEVENLGTHEMAVVSRASTGDGTPPTKGLGLRIVPAGTCRVVALGSHAWSIYGTAGDRCSVQVFTAGAAPGRGLGAVNGGGA